MAFYLVSIYAALFVGLAMQRTMPAQKFRKKYTILMFIYFTFIAACRASTVGVDTYNYAEVIYVRIANSSDVSYLLSSGYPLYSLLAKLCSFISPAPQMLIAFSSIFIMLGASIFIYYNSANIVFSWFYFFGFWFFFSSMNISRQYMAIALLLVAYTCFTKKKAAAAVILYLCAVLIHSSSVIFGIVFLAIAIARNRRWKKYSIGVGVVIGIGFLVLWDPFLKLFVSIFPMYNRYFGESVYSVADTSAGRSYLLSVLYALVVICALIFMVRNRNKLTEDLRVRLSSLTTILIFFLAIDIAANNSLLLSRVAVTFEVFIIALIPEVVEVTFNRRDKNLVYTLSVMASTVLLFVMLNGNYSGVLPYRFFWQ